MNLRGLIRKLQERGELVEVQSDVDPHLEIACLTNLQSKRQGSGLLFTGISGGGVRLATNLFGSSARIALALGEGSLEDFAQRLRCALKDLPGKNSTLRLQELIRRQKTEQIPLVPTIEETSLNFLPEVRFWPREVRTFLTLAVVISCDPDRLEPNYGLYRVGLAGDNQLTLNLLPGAGAGKHLHAWQAQGKPMPVAVLLGVSPALTVAASTPLPASCREDLLSAWVERRSLEVAKCSLPFGVPAQAEIILEGEVSAWERLDEGPFGCYRGNYGGGNLCPLVRLNRIRRVETPILPLTLAGPMPMEDSWLAQAHLAFARARLSLDLPEIEQIWQPLEAAFSGLYFVRCAKGIILGDLVRELQKTGSLRPLKGLIQCEEMPDAASDWRVLLTRAESADTWWDATADIRYLLRDRGAELRHPPSTFQALALRLSPSEMRQLHLEEEHFVHQS